jgi:pimeloyl-ACP methyl ester carboxylesterase
MARIGPNFSLGEIERIDGPPSPWLLQAEPARTATEFAAFVAAAPLLQAVPRGEAHPVLVLPGFMAGDASTLLLRAYISGLGYPVQGWQLGRNTGPSQEILDGMDDALRVLADAHGQPVSLVGWSLGGIYARELARRDPDRVRQVITLASPFGLADPRPDRSSRLFDTYSHLRVAPEVLPPAEDVRAPLAMPATAVYSRSDGIVAWQTCLATPGRQSENVEICSSHCGMGHHPAAVYVIADRLAQPEGAWAPFQPPALLRGLYPLAAAGPRAA